MKSAVIVKCLTVCALMFSMGLPVSADYGIMPITSNTLAQAQVDRDATPDYALPAGYVGGSREVNLLTNVTYEAKLRDQGHTGSCWMWGCQAVLWLDYARQYPAEALVMTNGFSLQFISSYLYVVDGELNMGGTAPMFKRFFEGFGYAVPWGNTNAAWTDGKGYVRTPPANIYTQPRMPVYSIALQDVPTFTASTNAAIALIKSVLDSGHALHFNLTLANGDEWDKFMNFWGKTNDDESTIFTNFVSGKVLSLETGGAHMMACVGYNDTDPDPANHYWLFLNSWSTGDNAEDTRRPHGTWRLPMNMDYSAHTVNGPEKEVKAPMFEWGILNTAFTNEFKKGALDVEVRLHESDPEQTQISIQAPITIPGVISNFYTVVVDLNDRDFTCSPAKGVWKQVSGREGVPPAGVYYEYTSNPGVTPAITATFDVQAKKWSCTITGLSPDDCRFIDMHRGLYLSAQYMPYDGADIELLCSEKAIAYDELEGLSQNSGKFSSQNKQALFTFVSPTSGVSFARGTTCVIEWTQQGLDGKLVQFTLPGFGASQNLFMNIADLIPVETGRYEWQVPLDILCVTNRALTATLGESLTFTGPEISLTASTNPALIVRSPAGGELWVTNTSRMVSWEGYNLSGDVTIELLLNGSLVTGSAVTAAASVGRLLYTLPGDLAAGEYTLRFGASGLSVTGAVFTVTNVQKAVKPWTILIYFDADNNLEASQMLDFLDIAKVGSTSNINVLVQMDRTPAYYIGYDNWYGAKRFYMTNGITPVIACALQDLGEVSMARPGTLTDFINWGVENYPASRYLLVMADHGNGWPGALWEDTPNALYNVPQPMTMFQQVLSNAVAPMTIVGYDCCNMAAIEAAYQLRNSGAGIYIGSQYMETKGWAYAEILQELEKTGGQMDTRALASRICDLSVSIYRPQDAATQTAVDLGKMQSLAEALTGFTSMMITNTEDRTRIREKADGVASNYYKAIVHHAANQQTERLTTGLNINFPNSEEHNIGGNYVSAVLDFKADANWLAFLQAYSNSLAVTWIGDARSRMGEGDDLDLMRFVNAIRPPDDTLWASFSLTGRGNLIGVPNNENLQFHRGETIQIVGQGEPAEQGGMNPRPATHFVRWWASDGVTFSNELTEATNWVTFAGNAVIIAYFSDNQSEYKVTYSPVGGGTLNGQRDAFELMVHHGSNAPAVSAVADAGCSFSGWGGDVNEHANPLVISNVISDLSILGLFWEVPEAWSNNTDTSWWHAGVTNFTLNTPQQLAGLAQIVNQGTDTFSGKTVMLGTNLDLAGKAWTPIGSSGHPYSGSANGAGFAINGLTIQKTAADDHQGLFGLVHSTGSIAIENLYLTNTDIVAGGFVGGLAGQVESVEGSILVRNCSNAGSVWGYGSLVGGLVGELTTGADVGAVTVSNCLNSARVNGASDAGGVAGRVLAQGDAIIANCSNEGALTAGGIEIGGVVGAVLSTKLSVTMDRCLNAGPVTAAADYVGGIVGQTQGGDVIVNGCQNSGNIVVTGAGHQYAGGVAGLTSASMPTFVNCINGGDVHGQNYVGGVAGMVPVSIKNCSNEGLVEGADRVGGVAGAVQGSGGVASVDNCMNSGQVTGSGRVGGIAGQIACDNASAASGDYFLKTDSVNTGLSYAGEMVPSTNLPDCATFASLTGVLSTNGYGNKTILVNALNAWVGENSGSYYWRTNRNATLVYPYPDPSLTEAVVTFSANGGIFTGGFNSSNKVYTLRQPYGSLADKPSKTNRAFVGWWYTPEPGVDSAKLVVDMTAVPSVTEVDAWWSTTIFAQTPFPAAVERMAEYYPAVATMTEAQINALANSLAANGRDKVWELIFLGLAPTNPAADPGAVFIYLTVSPVTIHTVPEKPIKTIPAYIVQGKELITDSSWTNIGQPGDSIPDQYRFFRVIEGSGK